MRQDLQDMLLKPLNAYFEKRDDVGLRLKLLPN